MPRTHPAVKEFRAHVATEFAYLTHDFGFRRERVRLQNQFSASFVNDTTRVYVEGINWGGGARVAFGSAGPLEAFENFDLLDFASIRCPDRTTSATATPQSQLSQLRALATLLRECGQEILRGDFSLAPQIRELQRRRLDEWEREEARRGHPRPLREDRKSK